MFFFFFSKKKQKIADFNILPPGPRNLTDGAGAPVPYEICRANALGGVSGVGWMSSKYEVE